MEHENYPTWYEDLDRYAERVNNMGESELDEEIKMLNRRVLEARLLKLQNTINDLLPKRAANVHKD